jgi:hypothetical protein
MYQDESVTYVPGPYQERSNKGIQATAV